MNIKVLVEVYRKMCEAIRLYSETHTFYTDNEEYKKLIEAADGLRLWVRKESPNDYTHFRNIYLSYLSYF